MAIENLNGLNKAAVLLICLGEQATARIFEELSDDEIRQITRIMAGISHIPTHIKEKVFENYREAEIRRKMFTFENLISLDGRSLQMVLREVNNDSLTMALKTASEEMKEKIFANMSSRAADMIRDDLEAMGPVRLSEVELMQQTIVKIAMKLEEEGKLILGGGSGDEFV